LQRRRRGTPESEQRPPEEKSQKTAEERQERWCGVGSRRTTTMNVYILLEKDGLKEKRGRRELVF